MTESVVVFLLDKLRPLLEEEFKLLKGIKEEVVYVKDELERMRAFLRAVEGSESMEEEGDEEIKVWIKQIREVAFDTEDVLDEFQLRLCHHRGHGFYGYLSKLAGKIKNLKARHRIASELRGIKSRLTSISEAHQTYSHSFNGSSSSSMPRNNNTWHELRGDGIFVDEAQLVGIETPKVQLIQLVLGDGDDSKNLQVIAIAGMGGLGKTTLVSKVYAELTRNEFQHHVWITVSHFFKTGELLRDVIQQLFDQIKQPLPQGADSSDTRRLKRMVVDFLCDKRYLLVLDDVWDVGAWNALRFAFPDNNFGSRLMITTRNSEVASTCTMEPRGTIYNLEPLSWEESWALFCAKTFRGNPCPRNLERVCQNFLKRCDGLPLAIVAIGGMLATKDQIRTNEWEMVERSLGAELECNDRLHSMKKILSLSFNDLPYNLKTCFMYLSIYPEDYKIRRGTLIRFWIAEGFVQEKVGRTVEEVGEVYLNELLNRSLIQVAEKDQDGRVKKCQVHDLLREIILLKSIDQNFVAIASEENKNIPTRVRRLSVHKTLEDVHLDGHTFSRLRSLLLFGVTNCSLTSIFMSQFANGGLSLLKVLDCRGALLDTLPLDIGKLRNLRYLSLRDSKLKSVPSSIGKLQNLETLDLRNTCIEELPVEILQLHRLRHIMVYRYIKQFHSSWYVVGFEALSGIETLSCLQSLCFMGAGSGLMESLGKLKELRRLCIVKLRAEDGIALCSSIEKLKYLHSLFIGSSEASENLNLHNISSPPPCLQRLYMAGRLGTLPQWICHLPGIVKLVMIKSALQADPLESLQDLPNLVELQLVQAYGGETLNFKAGSFKMLKTLSITNLVNLRKLVVERGALAQLEQLCLRSCKLLEEVPSGIQGLTCLEYVDFVDMADEFVNKLSSAREDYLGHVRDVYIGRQREVDTEIDWMDL